MPATDPKRFKCVVTYAAVSLRKTKKWLDGHATYNPLKQRLNLYDEAWKFLTGYSAAPDQICAGGSLDTGRYLIEIESLEKKESEQHRGWDGYTPGEDIDAFLAAAAPPPSEQPGLPICEPEDTKPPAAKKLHLEASPVRYHHLNIPKQDGKMIRVMYTDQKLKKNKIWHDGLLYYFDGKNKGLLYDEQHSYLDSLVLKDLDVFRAAGEIESARFILQWADDDATEAAETAPGSKAFVKSSALPLDSGASGAF